MKSTLIVVLLAAVMMFSSLAVGLDNANGQNLAGTNVNPAAQSGSYYLGNVIIYANGTVSNSTAITQSGNYYTLTSNINGTVTDLRSNSILNGNGYTINGNGSTAFYSQNVTGLTVENLVVTNSTEGIYLYEVSSALLNNDTLNGTSISNAYLIDVEFSGSVTIENSNISLGSSSSSYGIYAYSDSSVNMSNNTLSGGTNYYIVYGEYVASVSAWNNTVMSTYSDADAFEIEDGVSAVFGYNYINDTDAGIYADYEQSVTTTHNQIYNSSSGIETEDTTSFISTYDYVPYASSYAIYMEDVATSLVQYDNLSNSEYAVYSEYLNTLTVTNSNLSGATDESVYVDYGSTLDLIDDQINMSNSGSYAVDADYMSGYVNLVGDYIYIPNEYGLELYYSPYFNVTDSYINADDNIYLETSVLGANVNNNTFVTSAYGETVYFYYYNYLYNFIFKNNTVTSSSTGWADDGIDLEYVDYASSNIVVDNNTFINNYDPIYLYDDNDNGFNVWIQNNTFVNSEDTIDIEYYANVFVTGNTIQNVNDAGIYLYSDDNGPFVVSSNTIENMPGFGGFSYGIEVDDFYTGNNIISNNTVLNGGGSSEGIYVYDCLNTTVFNNNVNNSEYAYDIGENNVVSLFDNVASYSDEGIDSYDNYNFQYYSNTLLNDNESLYSWEDYTGTVYGNTFVDNALNQGAGYDLYLLDIEYPYSQITVYHNNFLNETAGDTVVNYIYNYSYAPVYMNAPLPIGGNYWSNYTDSGTNGIGNSPMPVYGSIMDYYPLTSKWTNPTVTFVAAGLPSGTSWSVSLGTSMVTSTGGSIVFTPTNGQYSSEAYSVSAVSGYTASTSSGTINLNGTSSVVTVTFTPVKYTVTFTESGLASGTTWSVTLNGATTTSTTSTISFSEPNGTYSYTVGSVSGYHSTPASGSTTVSSSSQTVSVSFAKNTYTLTVTQNGLPAGNSWNITVNGQSYSSTTETITIQLTSGSYSVNATAPSGYTVSAGVNVTMTDSNASTAFTFTQNKTTTPGSGGAMLAGIGIGLVVGAVAAALGTMFYTGTGVFANMKKGKGN